MRRLILLGCLVASGSLLAAEGAIATELGINKSNLPGNFSVLLQAWSVEDTNKAVAPHLNFRLRRAEIKLSGSPAKNFRYFVMADPAKTTSATDTKILQDLGVGFTVTEGLEIVAGQFKIQTTAEGLQSSSELLVPERSITARTYGDRREPGVMVGYKGNGYKVSAMASNGQGPNADATTDTKDLSVRAEVNATDWVTVGAFGLFGNFEWNKKGAYGVNTKLTPVEKLNVGVEFAGGKNSGVNSYGVATDVGYFVTEDLQPVVRLEAFRPDTTSTKWAQVSTLGVNYFFLKKEAKIQFAYSYLGNVAGNSGSPKVAAGTYGHLFVLAFQASI